VELSGKAHISAPRAEVWSALLDPDVLRACLPGCEALTPTGPDAYEASVVLGVAGIKGSYRGRVRITDRVEESRYRLAVEGAGGGNRIKGDAVIELRDAARGGTDVHYAGEAQIAGTLAVVGQRLLQPAAKSLTEKFFASIGTQVRKRVAEGRRA